MYVRSNKYKELLGSFKETQSVFSNLRQQFNSSSDPAIQAFLKEEYPDHPEPTGFFIPLSFYAALKTSRDKLQDTVSKLNQYTNLSNDPGKATLSTEHQVPDETHGPETKTAVPLKDMSGNTSVVPIQTTKQTPVKTQTPPVTNTVSQAEKAYQDQHEAIFGKKLSEADLKNNAQKLYEEQHEAIFGKKLTDADLKNNAQKLYEEQHEFIYGKKRTETDMKALDKFCKENTHNKHAIFEKFAEEGF